MRSLNTVALFVGLAAMVGCGDSDQSLNGVFPSSGFIGRKVRVEVSGDNASFVDGSTTVDFGAGVTVDKVSVASPTALFADITISDTAPLGARDVVVRDGGSSLTLKQAFVLESPVDFTTQGKLAQGSVVAFTARNLDFSSPFDTSCGASFFGMCLQYTGMQVAVPAGITAVIGAVDPYTVSGTFYLDLDAQGGPVSFTSGPIDNVDKQVISAVGTDTPIEARTALALTANSPTTTTVMEAFDSHLYEFTAAASSVARFSVSPGDPEASPTIYLLPESGRFTELVGASDKPNALTATGGKYYAIYADGSGLFGYSYAIRVSPLALTAVAEVDSTNNTSATAQNAGTNTSILLTNATISSVEDADWIRFTVPTGSSAKKVHVVTAGSDPMTDTFVEIYKDAEAADKLIGESEDSGYHEDTLSDAIGTTSSNVIFVKISGSPGYFQPEHNQYVAAIWLE